MALHITFQVRNAGTGTLPLLPAYVWEDSALTKPFVNSQLAKD